MSDERIACARCGAAATEEDIRAAIEADVSQAAAGYNPMSVQYAPIPDPEALREEYRRYFVCPLCRGG